jgi:hypothetical protein
MLQSHLRQFGLFACAVGVIGLSAFASQHVWRENGLKSLQAVNEHARSSSPTRLTRKSAGRITCRWCCRST